MSLYWSFWVYISQFNPQFGKYKYISGKPKHKKPLRITPYLEDGYKIQTLQGAHLLKGAHKHTFKKAVEWLQEKFKRDGQQKLLENQLTAEFIAKNMNLPHDEPIDIFPYLHPQKQIQNDVKVLLKRKAIKHAVKLISNKKMRKEFEKNPNYILDVIQNNKN